MNPIQKKRAEVEAQIAALRGKLAVLAELEAELGDAPATLPFPTSAVSAASAVPTTFTPPAPGPTPGKPPARPKREPTALPDRATDEKRAELLRLLAANADGLRVKEIAAATGWDDHVVRYHLKGDLFEAADPNYRLSPWVLSEAGERAAAALPPATAPGT